MKSVIASCLRRGGMPCDMSFFWVAELRGSKLVWACWKGKAGLHEMIRRPAGLHCPYSRSLRPPDAVSILWHLLMQKMAVT